MAMARERAATVRVDQATAVFSTKALSADTSRAAEPTASAAAESTASSTATAEASRTAGSERAADAAAGTDAAEPAVEGDTRLRAAVAAWVAGSDDAPASPGASGAGDGAGSGTAGADRTDRSDAATAAGEPAADAEDSADAEGADRADSAADAGSGKGAGTSAASGAVSEPDAATATTDTTADAVPAADERRADPKPDTASGETSGTDAPGTDAEPVKASTPDTAPASAPSEPADAEPGSAVSDSEPEDADPASEDAKDAEDAEPAPADAEPEDRPGAASVRDAAPAPEDAPVDAPGTAADTTPGPDAAGDAGPDATHDGDTAPQPPVDAAPADEPPVDQPTAVFKAPRPAVDQPTTMLKLGDAARRPAGGKADAKTDEKAGDKPSADKPAAEPAAKPVGDAERTSRFVALKSLDEAAAPARPKPPAAPAGADKPASATAVVPQVGPERTTQQPLPPKPPLDLLAELTNTPPPPQTPVRTIVRRVKIWTPLVLLLIVIFAVAQAFRPLPAPGLTLTADETYTFEGGTLDLPWPGQGQSAIEVDGVGSLGTDGKQTPAPVASVAKIMTAYVILQEHPLKGNEDGEKITVDQQAEDESKLPDESTAAMSKGQQFTERQMLQMLMIPSGNNVARLLARWDSDSKSFVAKMNAAAKDLGMKNSTYTDPSGLQKTTVSTAVDQIKLAKKVMQNDVFRSVVGMAKADIPGLDNTIYNNNDLLVQQVGVIGLKTGSSTPAGGNLVWAATKNVDGKTQTIYGAVMNQNAGTGKVWDSLHLALTNSQKLIDKVQKSLTTATVVKKGQVVGYVDDQLGGRTPVVATKNMTAVGWPGLKTHLSIGAGDTAVPHTGKAGAVVGELTVGDGSSRSVKIPVALKSDLAEPALGAKLTRIG
ncbi:D-alanyl-D-alanine carboxypeptidase [Streptomyces sp. NPDC048643]|uniref:D-alanyl-D-alanine carboxypeptidase n=1 Tax=Streptomyces sp. NPDC048643 TaxID=3155637 RepID=UPI00341417C0